MKIQGKLHSIDGIKDFLINQESWRDDCCSAFGLISPTQVVVMDKQIGGPMVAFSSIHSFSQLLDFASECVNFGAYQKPTVVARVSNKCLEKLSAILEQPFDKLKPLIHQAISDSATNGPIAEFHIQTIILGPGPQHLVNTDLIIFDSHLEASYRDIRFWLHWISTRKADLERPLLDEQELNTKIDEAINSNALFGEELQKIKNDVLQNYADMDLIRANKHRGICLYGMPGYHSY